MLLKSSTFITLTADLSTNATRHLLNPAKSLLSLLQFLPKFPLKNLLIPLLGGATYHLGLDSKNIFQITAVILLRVSLNLLG